MLRCQKNYGIYGKFITSCVIISLLISEISEKNVVFYDVGLENIIRSLLN